MAHRRSLTGLCGLIALATFSLPLAGQTPRQRQIEATARPVRAGMSTAGALAELRGWHAAIDQSARAGTLVRTGTTTDGLVAGRVHERYAQAHRGVLVFGADLVRQLNGFGQAESIFGRIYDDVEVDVAPRLTADAVRARLVAGGAWLVPDEPIALVILPTLADYTLTWTTLVTLPSDGWIRRVFLDARTGLEVFSYNDTWTQRVPQQGAIGQGTGLLGERLKISTSPTLGGFTLVDVMRPPQVTTTYDLKGDVERAWRIAQRRESTTASDIGLDTDNAWTDRALASAHAYAGLTFDYLWQQHDHAGLDGFGLGAFLHVNPANAADAGTRGGQFPLLFNNAFQSGSRSFFGAGSSSLRNFAAGLDVVAHEMTHGVTAFSSNLIYLNESGALNEAFSDIIGTAVEFTWQTPGSSLGQADWLLGEDIFMAGGAFRSLSNPVAFFDPDHYSIRLTGNSDNGGVHSNSGIINHMYYLVVLGGTHRLSGLAVQGLGMENRLMAERVIFRAFTQMLPQSASFSTARAATIQAARDLYGDGPVVSAFIQAWNAVGVE